MTINQVTMVCREDFIIEELSAIGFYAGDYTIYVYEQVNDNMTDNF